METGCYHPGPIFVRSSNYANVGKDMAIIHASYKTTDPWIIFGDLSYLVITETDEQQWSQPMRLEKKNQIPLVPGLHWIRVEQDFLIGPKFWVAFEINVRPGHQYSLVHSLGCQISFNKDKVQDYDLLLEIIRPDNTSWQKNVDGICSYSENSNTCRSDIDCQDNMRCVVQGKTGFGLCGDLN
jgi:hypothetical protein